jgi:hypothetical protein
VIGRRHLAAPKFKQLRLTGACQPVSLGGKCAPEAFADSLNKKGRINGWS